MSDYIQTFYNDVANNTARYVAALSIIGGVSMALLETLKDLLPVRQWFQRYYLNKWMKAGAAEAGLPGQAATNAERDLLKLAVDGDASALYDLQIEQMCGQFTAAIQIVLEFPALHSDLLKITASQARTADLALVIAGSNPPTQDFLDARNRVTHQCQRAIDAFQITAGFRWKWILQIASIALSVVLVWVAMTMRGKNVNAVSIIVSALLAGFLAPVAKDLLAVLDKARGK